MQHSSSPEIRRSKSDAARQSDDRDHASAFLWHYCSDNIAISVMFELE